MRRFKQLFLPASFLITGVVPTDGNETSFHEDIAPIIYENCADCHHPGGIGPFSLINYEQVRRRARQIAEVTASRYMPPWKPDPSYGPAIQGERHLSREAIDKIQAWYAAGAPEGNPSKAPPAPDYKAEWKLGEPDLVLELDEPYLLPAEGIDIYRNFVISLPIEETRYIRAFELRPRTRLAIHHALLMFDTTGRSRLRDREEAGSGFDGMGIGSSEPPSGHIVGWTPGQVPYQAYPGTAWVLEPGTDLVLQLHLLPSGKIETINPQVGLYLANEPPTQPSFVIQMRSYDLEIPAGEPNYLVEQSFELPVAVEVLSVYPHAHYLGKDIQLFAALPNGDRQWLLRIPDWDFNWQGDYRYEEPLFLPEGSIIHMQYRFDNSAENPRNPTLPPVDVYGGWRSEDEMAEAMIQVMPVNAGELETLKEAQKSYDVKLAGGEARFHYFSGIYLERQNETARAAEAYQRALSIDPAFASAYVRLADLAERRGDLAQAELLYEEAVAYQPRLIPARLGIAKLMIRKNQLRQAGFILEEVYSENPDHLQACLFLARYHLARGETGKALAIYADGESIFKNFPTFHFDYGMALLNHEPSRAKGQFLQALEALPQQTNAGSIKPLRRVQAEAAYQLARLHLGEGENGNAQKFLDVSLSRYPDHLDALLTRADLLLKSGNTGEALDSLVTLVDRPADQSFIPEDILANLPHPEGIPILVEAYRTSGREETADQVVARALENAGSREERSLILSLIEQAKVQK